MTITRTTYGNLPAVQIDTPDGAQAIVTLFGAHLVSWKTPDGRQRLCVSRKSSLDGSRAIRGGVPVIFPQFAERGTGMRHGFARVSSWRSGASGMQGRVAFSEFDLDQGDLAPEIAAAWPYAFALTLRVALEGRTLRISLDVRNTGNERFEFAAALHTYYCVDPAAPAKVFGLEAAPIPVREKIDRIYRHIGAPIGMNALKLEQAGFRDAVVWNPGPGAGLPDLDDEEYREFVCIEPAAVDAAPLLPGELWTGTHLVSA